MTGEIKIESQLFQLDTMDKVFLLSDVDEFYDQLEKIFKGNQTDVQGRWVVSNPCFEIRADALYFVYQLVNYYLYFIFIINLIINLLIFCILIIYLYFCCIEFKQK